MTSEVAGKLTLAYDAERNLLVARGVGAWSIEQIERQLRDLGFHTARIRLEHGPIRFLVDLRGAGIQSPEGSALMADRARVLYRHGDRLAFVMTSALLKEQMLAPERNGATETFTSVEAAERWLLAHDAFSRQPELGLEWIEADPSPGCAGTSADA
jgi:hypothetical protein